MNLDSALAAHMEWKLKLRSAIAGQSPLDVGTISRDNCCPLGQWLHGDAKAKYGSLVAYRSCLDAHATFHREAGKVAMLINDKKYTEAETALGAGTPYAAASNSAGGAIIRLKTEANL